MPWIDLWETLLTTPSSLTSLCAVNLDGPLRNYFPAGAASDVKLAILIPQSSQINPAHFLETELSLFRTVGLTVKGFFNTPGGRMP